MSSVPKPTATFRRVSMPGAVEGSVYIRASHPGGMVSRLADAIEEGQVDGARIFIALVRRILEADKASRDEAMMLLTVTVDHLSDVIGVADARAARLEVTEEEDEESEEDEGQEDDVE
ncbi:hypothetical protein ABZZ92_25075 [Streptomyces ardesiacus]|uniref:hypothetical protein n=1 Tax=Streptomyces ardesiacus TaxID=285564 RepID=UPI0006E2D351|nr:hypothetical protein [Streptomyces sp. NBRC 110030]